MGIVRAETIARARKAVKAGISASRFIADMKAQGLAYRRKDMLADYRTIKGVERVEGALRFVRKGYYPSEDIIATTKWAMAKDYTYRSKVYARAFPEADITMQFVSIQSDRPLTTAEIESESYKAIERKSPKLLEGLERITPWTAIRKI